MFLALFCFAVGFSVGAWLGRREGRKEGAAAALAASAPPPTPSPPPSPSPSAVLGPPPAPPPRAEPATGPSLLGPVPVVPNRRALKKGLTRDDFVPKDDILIRMQEAWQRGEPLDPADGEGPTVSPELDEKLQRVLARLADAPPGEGEPTMPQDPAPEAAPGGETVSEAVNELAAMGYGDDLRFDDGVLRCSRCGETHPSQDADVEQVRRFEGQSDPADEAIVLALRCPHCGAGGVLVSPYGPDADPSLAEAFTYLASRAGHG